MRDSPCTCSFAGLVFALAVAGCAHHGESRSVSRFNPVGMPSQAQPLGRGRAVDFTAIEPGVAFLYKEGGFCDPYVFFWRYLRSGESLQYRGGKIFVRGQTPRRPDAETPELELRSEDRSQELILYFLSDSNVPACARNREQASAAAGVSAAVAPSTPSGVSPTPAAPPADLPTENS